MSEVRCTCGAKGCPIKVNICGENLFMTDKRGEETLMYLDANALVAIVKACQKALLSLAVPQQT